MASLVITWHCDGVIRYSEWPCVVLITLDQLVNHNAFSLLRFIVTVGIMLNEYAIIAMMTSSAT